MPSTAFNKLHPRIRTCIDESRDQIIAALSPSEEQLERAEALHSQAVVCDSYGMGNSCHWAGLPYSVEMDELALLGYPRNGDAGLP